MMSTLRATSSAARPGRRSWAIDEHTDVPHLALLSEKGRPRENCARRRAHEKSAIH
jgi:hypothetical protein